MTTLKYGMLIPGAVAALCWDSLFIEPDRGSTILLAAVTGIILVTGGCPLEIFRAAHRGGRAVAGGVHPA